MRFDWQRFCSRNHIRFVATGPSATKGNIYIHCPFCGAGDSSEHMGLSTDPKRPFWGCWRNARHRGRDPVFLIQRLLGIGRTAAEALVLTNSPPLDDFEAAVDALKAVEEEARPIEIRALDLPGQFRALGDGRSYAERFVRYMRVQRGFYRDTEELLKDYEIYYALTGQMAWRVIFPIRRQDGTLIGWTGRATHPGAKIRYLTTENLPNDAYLHFGGAWLDRVLVCEGPLDALKLDFYGRRHGFRAIATMGAASAIEKVIALHALPGRRTVVFDADATGQALAFADEIGASCAFLPSGVKDPGEMAGSEIDIFLQKMA